MISSSVSNFSNRARRSVVDRELARLVDADGQGVLRRDEQLDPAAALGDDPQLVVQLASELWISTEKSTPGERCSWLTITRSAPLMMNSPPPIMIGISPR